MATLTSGSNSLTTYYAKRIIGDTNAQSSATALLQTGTGIQDSLWILGNTVHDTYGIKYLYDGTNSHDKLQAWGGGNAPTAWVQLDNGNTYILGQVGIGYDPNTSGNTRQLYVTGTVYFNIGTSDNSGDKQFIIGHSGQRYLSFGGAGVQAYDSSDAVSTLYLNYNGGTTYVGANEYIIGKVGIGYNPDTSGNTYKLYVNGDSYLSNNNYFCVNTGYANFGDTVQFANTTSWNKGTLIVGANGSNKIIIGQLNANTNGAVIGAHASTCTAWAPLYVAGTAIYIRGSETTWAKWVDGCLSLFPTSGSYREGLRIHSLSSWSDITLCGNDNTGDSGTSANSWFIGNNNGNFYIARNGSSTGTSLFGCVSNVWRLTTSADIPQNAANFNTIAIANYMLFYRNGIVIPNPGTINDGGFLRVRGTGESDTILELGTWDDSGAGETIQFNYYPTTSQITPTYSISVPKHSGTLVTTDGYGATGTWGISITSSAQSLRSLGNLSQETGRTSARGGVYTYNMYTETGNGAPSSYLSVIGFGRNTGGHVEIAGYWCASNGLWYRSLRDTTDNWFGWTRIWVQGNSVTSAVWNDYAECRESHCEEFGYVVYELGDDTVDKTTERLQHFAGITSDTWGFSQGETEKAKTPIAVAGRVLVYPYRPIEEYKPGDCVCAAPGGTVDIMTREEVVMYPDRIVGTVSCIPTYEEWGGGKNDYRNPIKVNGRIWVKVK